MDEAAVIVGVRAYAFASTFKLRELVGLFPAGSTRLLQDELRATLDGGGEAICFDFGAVVFFDGPADRRDALVAAITARVKDTQRPRTEDFLVEVRAGAKPDVQFDRVILPELTEAARDVIAVLVAQSAAMDYYEDDVGEILVQTERITRDLKTRGRMRGRVRDIVKFIGHCVETRNEVIETLALFDKPDVTWEQEALDRLFVQLRRMLEIDDRFRALEYRLQMIQDSLVLLVDLSRGESNYRLEVSVVVLILLELVLMVWQMFRGHA